MQLTTFLPVALLSSLSFTSALPSRRYGTAASPGGTPPSLNWQVTNFTTGCSPAACTYDFNIFGAATPNTPGFNTTCSGNDTEDVNACNLVNITTTLTPKGNQHWNLEVNHYWTQGIPPNGAEFWAKGNANITTPIARFTVPVTEEYGVA